MSTPRLATVWLDGCSGCHMSFLDTDDALLELSTLCTVVYSPLVDTKEFPEGVDVTLVEGSVSSVEDEEKIARVRRRTRILVALGDCAVTGNVPAMRTPFPLEAVLHRAFVETAQLNPGPPTRVIPRLLPRVRPVHEVVPVDVVIPGCPPPAAAILDTVKALLAGQTPRVAELTRFGR
ncbi:MAG: NADP oxidoreductase [Acidobacteriota bacterium]|jgi:NAD-reducing hydrogenase small subunit